MPRFRALLAILLVGTWCSAVWHVGLEGVGLMFDHEHHSHGDRPADHAPTEIPHHHHEHEEEVFARDLLKDQVRVGAAVVVCFALLRVATSLGASLRASLAFIASFRERRETDPPLAHVWQFVQRCAPESAAPPALG